MGTSSGNQTVLIRQVLANAADKGAEMTFVTFDQGDFKSHVDTIENTWLLY